MESPLQEIHAPELEARNLSLWMKREDQLHPFISGNKWRKLKYNLQEALTKNKTTLLTFGGAYSNHIAATAAAGKEYGLQTVGIIRGEEHLPLNPTLSFAASQGMKFNYLSREKYREKNTPEFLEALSEQFPDAYIIPEGGTNSLAVKGCTEIIEDIDLAYDYICCASGTGGTLAGIIAGLKGDKKVLGFPALKGGEFLYNEIEMLIQEYNGQKYTNWQLITEYHFGGYAKVKPELIDFIQTFKKQHGVLLDPIYTGKMMYGVFDMIKKDYFPAGSKIIALHTGGLQGNEGFRERLGINI
jgi:1-aminocyclopropane-1-carboxylate deaminase